MNPKEEKKVLRICKNIGQFVKNFGDRTVFGDYNFVINDLNVFYSDVDILEKKLMINSKLDDIHSVPIVAVLFNNFEVLKLVQAKEILDSMNENKSSIEMMAMLYEYISNPD